MMSWIRESSLNFIQKLCLLIVKQGRVPQHIAFIMDGNRRYASKNNVIKTEGHSKGFDKLSEVLKWCLDLGVLEVTVYAFSIENFKRNKEEVDALLDLARQKFERLLEEEDALNKEGVNIRVIGDLSLLPDDLQKLVAKAVCMTRSNKRARLNVAFSYTARNEITAAVKSVVQGVNEGKLEAEDISPALLEKSMYTEDSVSPDLVIRTSGEIRFSDFMLWQSSCSCVYFTPVLWPEFTIWELLGAVFQYQRSINTLNEIMNLERKNSSFQNERTEHFLSELYNKRYDRLKQLAS